ncbi:MAG: dihydrolipoamide dehydrogenase [Yoonia sp.]
MHPLKGPLHTAEAVKILHATLEAQDVTIQTQTKVCAIKATKKAITLSCEGAFAGALSANAVIQLVGRRSNGPQVLPDNAGIETDARGIIIVDTSCRTNVNSIFAIGDVTGNPMLAHRATHQGHVAAEVACGHAAALDTKLIPRSRIPTPNWFGSA